MFAINKVRYFSSSRCDILTYLSHLLLVLNSSMNIVIYCWKVLSLFTKRHCVICIIWASIHILMISRHQYIYNQMVFSRTRSSGKLWYDFSPRRKWGEIFRGKAALRLTTISTPWEAVGDIGGKETKTWTVNFPPWRSFLFLPPQLQSEFVSY